MINKWRVAFWICFVIFIVSGLFGLNIIFDQGVTITYMQKGYKETENDLRILIEFINKTNFTKVEIEESLKNHRLFDYMNFNTDVVVLERVLLHFENDRLEKVTMQW